MIALSLSIHGRGESGNSTLILDSTVLVPGIVHEERCMHVSAALPYAGGLPPSIFKRSVILIPAMKNMVSRPCGVGGEVSKVQSTLPQLKFGSIVRYLPYEEERSRQQGQFGLQRRLRHFPAEFCTAPVTRLTLANEVPRATGTCVCGSAVPDCESVPGMTSACRMHGAFRMPRSRRDTAAARGSADRWRSPWNEW